MDKNLTWEFIFNTKEERKRFYDNHWMFFEDAVFFGNDKIQLCASDKCGKIVVVRQCLPPDLNSDGTIEYHNLYPVLFHEKFDVQIGTDVKQCIIEHIDVNGYRTFFETVQILCGMYRLKEELFRYGAPNIMRACKRITEGKDRRRISFLARMQGSFGLLGLGGGSTCLYYAINSVYFTTLQISFLGLGVAIGFIVGFVLLTLFVKNIRKCCRLEILNKNTYNALYSYVAAQEKSERPQSRQESESRNDSSLQPQLPVNQQPTTPQVDQQQPTTPQVTQSEDSDIPPIQVDQPEDSAIPPIHPQSGVYPQLQFQLPVDQQPTTPQVAQPEDFAIPQVHPQLGVYPQPQFQCGNYPPYQDAPRPLPFGIPQYPGYCQFQWGGYPSVNPWIVPSAVQPQAQGYQQP